MHEDEEGSLVPKGRSFLHSNSYQVDLGSSIPYLGPYHCTEEEKKRLNYYISEGGLGSSAPTHLELVASYSLSVVQEKGVAHSDFFLYATPKILH